jgi:hypothetical protein
MKNHKAATLAVAIAAAFATTSASADQTYASYLTQIGVTTSIESAADWGRGSIIAAVDSGFTNQTKAFAPGQVSVAQSVCAAVSFKCSNGVADDNNHGTAVLAVALGNINTTYTGNTGTYAITSGMQTSVAPNANGIAFKVTTAAGSTTAADVANGITLAANAGALVINVSISYAADAKIVAALNFAATKGAYVVWAGANSATAFNSNISTTGLTAAAIQHLIFVGAVNQNSLISSYSNTPGTGQMYTTSTTTGAGTTYSSRWLVAPGDGLLVPVVSTGGLGGATGTSFSAPIVSGSLALVESAWPILKTNGTAENLLLATANASYTYQVTTPAVAAVTKVIPAVAAVTAIVPPKAAVYSTTPAVPAVTKVVPATKTTPATIVIVTPAVAAKTVLVSAAVPATTVVVTPAVAAYTIVVTPAKAASTTTVTGTYAAGTAGKGELNLAAAFQPVGALSVNGLPISGLTTSVIAGGALGSLSTVTAKLSNMVALDSYQRNFSVNLSGLIAKTPTAAKVNPLPANTNSGVNKMKFSGGELAFMMPMSQSQYQDLSVYGKNDFAEMVERTYHAGYVSFTDGGNSFTVGNSVPLPAQYTYSKLMYGSEEIAMMAGDLGTHLVSYSQSNYGNITAYGAQVGNFRIAIGFNGTGTNPATGFNASTDTTKWHAAEARSVTRGVSYAVNKEVTLGYSQSVLTEQHGLLGSTYDSSSALSLGNEHVSKENSVSGMWALDANRSLYLEYSEAMTNAAKGNGGLVNGNSVLTAQSFGASFTNQDVYRNDDKVSLTFKMPMQVSSGYTTMAFTTVDPTTGIPSMTMQQVSLAPSAREMDFGVSYAFPLSKTQKLGVSAGYMMSYQGDAGTNVVKAGFVWNVKM